MFHFEALRNAYDSLVRKLSLFGAARPAENRALLLLGHIFFAPDQILIGRGGRGIETMLKHKHSQRSLIAGE
jgi:hypothetical protein